MNKSMTSIKIGDTVTLSITGVNAETDGVARLDNLVVFVKGALLHETVEATITQLKKKFALAKTIRVIKASPERQPAQCANFGICGGCQLLHCSYPFQLTNKRLICQQTLSRIAGIELDVPLPLAGEKQLAYRDRAVMQVALSADDLQIGFFAANSRQVCNAAPCLLLRQPISEMLPSVQAALSANAASLRGLRNILIRCSADQERVLLAFVSEKPLPALEKICYQLQQANRKLCAIWQCTGKPVYSVYGSRWQLLAGDRFFADSVAGLKVSLSPASFLQVNSGLTAQLYATVADFAALQKDDIVWDLYSGVGTIAMFLAGKAKQIIAIESYAPAVQDALRSLELNNISNCTFMVGKTEHLLPDLQKANEHPDVVVLDPPRTGCDHQVLTLSAAAKPRRIIYVSCDMGTLARDCKKLTELGYTMQKIQPVDMFCQTKHTEYVCLFTPQTNCN